MYILTGGAGFIGSAFLAKLNQEGIEDILVVDDLGTSDKWKNLVGKRFRDYMHKDEFIKLVAGNKIRDPLMGIIHMGACSSTTERNVDYLMANNFHYTRTLASYAMENRLRFVYASSAATYGDGSQGYVDDHESLKKLRPLNAYGYSKHVFDMYAYRQFWLDRIAGVKFFNVFGPNEYHKGDMASVVYKAYQQVKATGKVKLFKSYHPDYKDGEQRRDFIYVKDCVDVLWWLLKNPKVNGIYNLGSGKGRTWNILVRAVFAALNKDPDIEYIDMPETLRPHYQYFTQADVTKLMRQGFPVNFRSLQDSIRDYIVEHLEKSDPHL